MKTEFSGIFLVPLLMLNACSSGGGGPLDPNDKNDLSGPGKITLENSTLIAYDAIDLVDQFNTNLATSVILNLDEAISPFSLPVTKTNNKGTTVGTEFKSCPTAGSQTVDISDTSIIWDYDGCVSGFDSSQIDGSIEFNNYSGAFVDDPLACPADFSASLNYNNLTLTNSTFATVLNGTSTFNLSVSTTNEEAVTCDLRSVEYLGSNIISTFNGITVANIKNLNFSTTLNLEEDSYASTYQGSVGLVSAQGQLTYTISSERPVAGNNENYFPSEGVITIEDGTAVLTITINSHIESDPDAISLSLDLDGDGNADQGYPANYSWDDLDAFF